LPGTEFLLKADLVFLAIGFAGSMREGLLEEAQLDLDRRGNVLADDRDYRTSDKKVFVAGDMRRGQSLIVWAIREGRQAARAIDVFLTGDSILPE
ncbi:MAG TPA: FAD-dependent oxidoreductase, partial [Beijerinckiaceae bacterium]|nr:FAD-dependent oxidoreductase [Beijerinckiaceae bacterium]